MRGSIIVIRCERIGGGLGTEVKLIHIYAHPLVKIIAGTEDQMASKLNENNLKGTITSYYGKFWRERMKKFADAIL